MSPADDKRLLKLRRFYEQRKRLPSYAEMLALFGLHSKNAIHKLVQRWIKTKIVSTDATGKIVPGPGLLALPVLGGVQAGFPSPAEEELVDAITLDDYLITNRTSTVVLRVSGDSMTGAGIQPHDLVIVERGRTPRVGDIVVAQVDTEWTIKHYSKQAGKIVLLPANKKYQPIYPSSELRIEGVVTGVIRKYY